MGTSSLTFKLYLFLTFILLGVSFGRTSPVNNTANEFQYMGSFTPNKANRNGVQTKCCSSDYFLSSAQSTWLNARAKCHEMDPNAKLVSIESAEEDLWLHNWIVQNVPFPNSFWTSGAYDQRNKIYRWFSTGAEFTYLNWAPKQPSGNYSYQKVLFFSDTVFQYNWRVESETSSAHFICEVSL